MKGFAAVVFLILVLPVLASQAQTEPPIRVSVDVHGSDSYGYTLAHHIKRQLGVHTDVTLTDAAPEFVLVVTMMQVRNHEGEAQGAVCSAIALGSAMLPDGGEAKLYYGDTIFTTPLEGIPITAQAIASWFNEGILNAVRGLEDCETPDAREPAEPTAARP